MIPKSMIGSSSLEAKLRRLPRDIGGAMIVIGTVGLVIPGPIPPGTLFLVLGIVFCSPGLLRPFGGRARRRFPVFYHVLEEQVDRFRSDLEGRYPGSTGPGSWHVLDRSVATSPMLDDSPGKPR